MALIRSMAGGLWRPTFHPSPEWFTIVSYSKAYSLHPDASQRCYQKLENRTTRGSKGHIVLASMFALCLDPTHMKEDSRLGQCEQGLDFPNV